jgi:hypothetical protein
MIGDSHRKVWHEKHHQGLPKRRQQPPPVTSKEVDERQANATQTEIQNHLMPRTKTPVDSNVSHADHPGTETESSERSWR